MKLNTDQVTGQAGSGVKSGNKPRPVKTKPKKGTPEKEKLDKSNATGNKNVYMDKWNELIRDGGLFRMNRFWIVCAALLGIILLSVNSSYNSTKMQLTLKIKRITSSIGDYELAIADVKKDLEEQARINSIKLTEEQEELARNNAIEQGVKAAMLQNAYRNLDKNTDREKYTENMNQLAACFDQVNGSKGQTVWYPSANAIPGTWEFASKAPFYGNTANVLWLCYADEDHTLLAYCTATYNASTQLFSGVEWKLTRYAESHIAAAGEGTANDGKISSVTDALKDLAESGQLGDIPDTGSGPDGGMSGENNGLSDVRETYKDAVANGDVDGEEYDERYNTGLPHADGIDDTGDTDNGYVTDGPEDSGE